MKITNLKVKKCSAICATLILFITGCSDMSPQDNAMMFSEESSNYTAIDVGAGSANPEFNVEELENNGNELIESRKLIKEAIVRYHKDSLSLEIDHVKNITAQLGGFVSGEKIEDLYNERQHYVQIKVTNDKFDIFMKLLSEGVVAFDQKDINVQDVTNDFFDLESRIVSEKKVEERYQALLIRANTIDEIIKLEKLISTKRVLIESFEGRMKVMERQVAFSTINVTVYKPILIKEAAFIVPTFAQKFTKAIGSGWSAVLFFIILIATIWPFFIVAGLMILFIRFLTRKRKKAVINVSNAQ